MRIGVYGGTFNPIHLGHISLLKQMRQNYSLDRIILIPTGQPPHKTSRFLASKEQRLTMCRLAVCDDPDITVYDLECRREGKSYMVHTLRQLRLEYPNDELFLILGSDMLLTFTCWKDYREILRESTLLVGARHFQEKTILQEKAKALCGEGGQVFVSDISVLPISSTAIRMRIAQGADCKDFLPFAVENYIKQDRLYSDWQERMEEIRFIVESQLTSSRFYHTQCVVKMAVELATRFGVDVKKAELAAWLHDILKNRSSDELLKMMREYGIILSEIEKKSTALWHAIVAPKYCERELGIVDSQVLAAIRYHTTGRANMSSLEQVIYLADAISEDRSYAGVEFLRAWAKKSLEAAMLASVTSLLTHLLSQGFLLAPDTVAAYQELAIKQMEDVL